MIPTYTLIGYILDFPYTQNNYFTDKKASYSYLSVEFGLYIQPLKLLYINSNIGYNYWYFYTTTLQVTKTRPLFFSVSIEYKF